MSVGYLLDTCAWLDAFNEPQLLRPETRSLINQLTMIQVASISLLEVSRKAETGDLLLSAPIERWFQAVLPPGKSQVLEITPEIAVEACRLPAEFHKDPADRLIVATARLKNLVVITSDHKILGYPHVRSLASR